MNRARISGGCFPVLIFLGWLTALQTGWCAESTDWQGLPEDVGREEVFSTCQACHSLALVHRNLL
ncbi:MAG: hypothetical protein HQM02_05270 [Magnetococcales bacterium]|nr:hypothetical protein [Magnetococcales bacterium]